MLEKRNKNVSIYNTLSVLAVCIIIRLLFSIFPAVSFLGCTGYVVSSPSMETAYPVNSIVIVKKTPFNALSVGDVVAFKSVALGGAPALHRIVRKTPEGVYTKGDNNNFEDGQLITEVAYLGKEVFTINAFARYITAIRNPLGFLLYFIAPFAACVALEKSLRFLFEGEHS